MYVGDALFGVSPGSIEVELMRTLKSRSKLTGGDRLVTECRGLEVDQNPAAQSTKPHRPDFGWSMLRKFNPEDDPELQKTYPFLYGQWYHFPLFGF